jgi:metal-responsive CopG/Arc/MetJ family transcriptional regulator
VKTTVSLPDELFKRAEAAARRLRVSRGHLFAAAIREFLEREKNDQVTERLNHVYARRRARLDPALHRAQMASLPKEKW